MSENSLIRRVGNFLGEATFPLDSDTLDALQNNQTLLAMLGNIFGDSPVILSGGEVTANEHASGYAFVKTADYPGGEILPFESGSINGTLYLKSEIGEVSVASDTGTTTYTAYNIRRLSTTQGGTGESFKWSDFFSLKNNTIPQLRTEISANTKNIELINNPVGTIHIWAGGTGDWDSTSLPSHKRLPKGYLLCDGREIKQADYSALYEAIGDNHDNANIISLGISPGTKVDYFRIPDLRGRFVVGLYPGDGAKKDNFSTIADTGGEKEHLLTDKELPAHSHGFNGSMTLAKPLNGGIAGGGEIEANWNNSTYLSPEGISHQNLPPYYVLSYIIKAE